MRIGWKPKSSDESVASVRFRCLSPLREMQRTGFPVELFDPSAAREYDLVVFSKLYSAKDRALAAELSAAGVSTALDLSDNHIYNPRQLAQYHQAADELREMTKVIDQLICCSQPLAQMMRDALDLKRPPMVVGDAVEALTLPADARDPFELGPDGVFRLVWFGSHGSPNAEAGMSDLLRLRPHFARAAKRRRCELVVLSNNETLYQELAPQLPIASRYRDWQPESFMEELGRANLVVVPITPNPFTKCKTNNRLATTLWYGIPVVSDRIPAYDPLSEFAVLSDWERGFDLALSFSREMALRTTAGMAFVRAHYNTQAIAAEWRRAFKRIIDGRR
tara:strand:- start:2447 stop:3451 length:1005 start_codon:yes stop_codon:yes gene_type:complete